MYNKSLVALAILTQVSGSFALQAQNLTKDNGAPVGDNQNAVTAGPNGSTLLQDVHLIQKLQRFARERIPERVVHARGTGAHGEFVVSQAIPDLTIASLFAQAGKKTPVFVRFSTVVHGNHSPETLRAPRGLATKFYTNQGKWDLVDNMQDPNRVFDFMSQDRASAHMLTQVYSDLCTGRCGQAFGC